MAGSSVEYATITEFIKAQHDEDERVARAASGGTVIGIPGNWETAPAGDEWEVSVSPEGDEELLVALRPGLARPPDFTGGHWGAVIGDNADDRGPHDSSPVPALLHAALHDPRSVLLRVAAGRRTLARHCRIADVRPGWAGSEWADRCYGCGDGEYDHYVIDVEECPELLDLAAPYCDRPGFKAEWRVAV